MVGVLAEAILVTWLVRPTVRAILRDSRRAAAETGETTPLTMRRVIGFHAPLAATSLLTLFSQPLISAGLARMAFAEQSLAAWPVANSLVLFARSFGLATQEVVIALSDGPGTLRPLGRFAGNVAIGSILTLACIAFTPLVDIYLSDIAGVSSELADFIIPGVRAALLIPGLTTLQSWLRALLMKGEATTSIYQAMGINLLVTALALIAGVVLNAPGIQMAAVALTVAMLAELGFLRQRAKRAVVVLQAGFAEPA